MFTLQNEYKHVSNVYVHCFPQKLLKEWRPKDRLIMNIYLVMYSVIYGYLAYTVKSSKQKGQLSCWGFQCWSTLFIFRRIYISVLEGCKRTVSIENRIYIRVEFRKSLGMNLFSPFQPEREFKVYKSCKCSQIICSRVH